uniref:PKD domain-containing protein n=1 Tax=Fulvivirga sp. TaxID=1931237 RepID=UPI00404AC019
MKKAFLILICNIITINSAQAQANMTIKTSPDGNEYLLYLPDGHDPSQEYPLILYLHGAQALKNGIDKLSGKGLPRAIAQNNILQGYPFIMIAPHAKGEFSNDFIWNIDSVAEVLADVEHNYLIDQDRIIGVGISLGAKGIWDFALTYPDKFAGIVPISGNSSLEDICTISDVAVWAFHGDSDGLIPMDDFNQTGRSGSQVIVESLTSCSPSPYLPPLLTVFKAKGHNGWDQVFDLSSGYPIYDWMESLDKGVIKEFEPLVKLGSDKTFIASNETLKINSFAMDPDGDDLTLQYSWVKLSGPSLYLQDASSPTLATSMDTPGVYTFRLTVTDLQMNTASDEISIELITSSTNPEVTALQFFYDGNFIDNINGDYLVDMSLYDDPRKINIAAATQNLNSRASVRFSLDDNGNFFTINDNANYTMGGDNSSAFLPSDGASYNITATAFADRNGIDPGVSFQSTVNFSSSPLPVELISFTAKRERNEIVLNWKTAEEINHSHFEIYQGIERVSEMQKIEEISESKSSSNLLKHYEYRINPAPSCGKLYYQLRNVDFDGAFGYSKIISTESHNVSCEDSINLYPNPNSTNELTLQGNILYDGVAIKILTMEGQVVKDFHVKSIINQSVVVDINGLKAGLYYVQIREYHKKLVVK